MGALGIAALIGDRARAAILTSLIIWNDYVRDPSDGHPTVIRQVLKRHQSQRIAGWLSPESDRRARLLVRVHGVPVGQCVVEVPPGPPVLAAGHCGAFHTTVRRTSTLPRVALE